MSASYPTWKDRAQAALDESRRPKPGKPPKAPTRAELIAQLREELRELTARAPTVLRGRVLVLLDAIAAAKR